MSEVVPLPSFGEVFFDERGQERVLRVTWHEGTLVLSLWRGEMCTASFRMPMDDVARLVDTLDQGFIDAGGRYPDEVDEHAPSPGHGEFPGTGQYARPRPEDYVHPQPSPQPPPQPQQYADPAAAQAAPPPAGPPEDLRQPPVLGPNDVLVARGSTPPPDPFQDRAPGYGAADAVPRENLIVGDSLPYGQPHLTDPAGPGEQPYPAAGARGDQSYAPGDQSYAPGDQSYAPGDRSYAPSGDRYGVPQSAAPYGGSQPDAYGVPETYGAPQRPADSFAAQQSADPFSAQQPVDPFSAPPSRQRQADRPVDPFTPHVEQFPAPPAHPDVYPAQGHSTDPFGFAAQSQQSPQSRPAGHEAPASDPYGYPAAQPAPFAFGESRHAAGQAPAQGGHPADLRDLYGPPSGYEPQAVNPSDPLNLRGHQAEQQISRPYVQEPPPHSTGERLRPEPGYDDRDDRRGW
ncbi:hypothetical protein GCM10010156_50180 [Planobispora rosea]|uniref:Uncharacterized protein n=1 Tax=Planobispora rosea TaxID=35762 RepID=A0A8J3WBQ5_PLARO|nr:hypothetical protein [Planobispora rosea]GGS85590.1 hypothetical protein GCM10010156_50180 [Planobispora rosea]GIH83375.1 hypothetical protein Pro02_17830 [Planobispora rosea]